MEQFACETRVVSGQGALEILGEQKCRRLLVVTDAGKDRDGQMRRIRDAVETDRIKCMDIAAGAPTMKQAVEGSKELKDFSPDLVVAIGCSNTLELGKAMVCFSGCSCILAAVPTACCAGSEMTDRVTLNHNGRKYLLQNRAMRPDLAILDSGLQSDFSQVQTREAGFELLAAALEVYTAENTGMITGILAREGFVQGCAVLPAACAGRETSRMRLHTASVLTGLAVNGTGLGLCRAMANSLEIVFGLSSGKAAGILLPVIIGCNAHAAGYRYAELARAAGMGASREDLGTRNLKAGLIRLRRELGMPGTLLQAGIDIRTIWNGERKVVELTLEDPECRNNPVAVDDFLVRRILEEITGRF